MFLSSFAPSSAAATWEDIRRAALNHVYAVSARHDECAISLLRLSSTRLATAMMCVCVCVCVIDNCLECPFCHLLSSLVVVFVVYTYCYHELHRILHFFADSSPQGQLNEAYNAANASANDNNNNQQSDDELDDDEDYSVSVTAIIQRRASVRGYRGKRGSRYSRRASSPMDHLMDTVERRRSSVYTSSSGKLTVVVV